ncbi:MAG: hypothetical protein A3F41_04215 [Coxiella sp. RIFCSPHIGHO2_12_FULL_44_14]|nr:MAG: hypothetical protein A3F41_04215 [Coxiella sp. RIFCSPHIGHO2_12_FULL_44_14]
MGILTGFSAFFSCFLWGCSPVKLPDISTYKLASVPAFTAQNYSKRNATLYVAMLGANPGYQTADMLYMATPYKLSAFALHQWIAPPAQMIQPIVIQAIRSKGYFKAVLSMPSSSNVDYRLELQLLELQQEFLTSNSKIRMSVQATLINNTTNEVLASHRFSELLPTAGNTPYAGVLSANMAITHISTKIAAFCISHLK